MIACPADVSRVKFSLNSRLKAALSAVLAFPLNPASDLVVCHAPEGLTASRSESSGTSVRPAAALANSAKISSR